MTPREFDRLLALHCAPALAGIKPANLISVQKTQCAGLNELLEVYNLRLKDRGIRMEILCRRKTYALLLVYRGDLLWRELRAEKTRRFLTRRGYRDWHSLGTVLADLKRRLRFCPVPHEIGLFLGYPLEDVAGFIEHGGRGCKVCGYWKVYSDEEAAQRRFQEYTLCRAVFCRRVRDGDSLLQLLSSDRPAFSPGAKTAFPQQKGTAAPQRTVP